MTVTHGDAVYTVDDEWLAEAGMAGFVPAHAAYRADGSAFPQLNLFEVALADVKPVHRQLSHGVFNDSPTAGTARARVVRILEGFRNDSPIAPVEVLRLTSGPNKFELYHGAHRFCCAVIAGFSAVPAVDVTERPAEVIDLDEPRGGRTRG